MAYVTINDESFSIDTAEQEAAARAALHEAGIESAAVYAGEPDDESSLQDKQPAFCKGKVKPRKPGKNIPNSQRHTRAVLLRLRPETETRLRKLAAERGLSIADAVAGAVAVVDEVLEFETSGERPRRVSEIMKKQVPTGFVKTSDGTWLVQKPADNQWGFVLCDDDQSWDGGVGIATSFELVAQNKVPKKVREELGWLLDD